MVTMLVAKMSITWLGNLTRWPYGQLWQNEEFNLYGSNNKHAA